MAQSLAYRIHLKMGTGDAGQSTAPSVICRPSSEVHVPWLMFCLMLAWISPAFAGDSYDLAFSTYFGGSGGYGNGDCILAKFSRAATITLDPSKTYQTIRGWEAVAFALEPTDPAFPNFRDTLFDQVVNDLGLNRVRLEVRSGVENTEDNWTAYQTGAIDYPTWRSRRYATVNDNADSQTLNPSGYHFSEMDNTIDRIVSPLRKLLEARGEKLIVNVNYVAFTGQITTGTYLHNNPAEYAEFVLATYLHLKERYGWTPDLWEVLLEPDNVSQWNGQLLGQAIVAAAGRLQEAGFEPAFVAPSNTNMGNAVTWFDRMIAVPGVLPVLREYAYHRYGGVSLANLQAIAARAQQHHLDTAMLEWWSSSNGYATLHEDLKIGNNSAWEQGVLGGALNAAMSLYQIDTANPAQPRVLIGSATKFLRQYYKFVRPGAVRIEAASQVAAFDPVAFINTDGDYAVVVKCGSGGSFSIGSLPAGAYGIKYTTAGAYDVDLPDQTISAGQAVTAAIPQAGVLTVYGKPTIPDNQPPSAPAKLVAKEAAPGRVALTWDASTDDVGVAGYKIYRDGVRIGFSPTPAYEDATAEPGVSYTYEVSAYDAAGQESPRSAALVVAAALPPLDADLLGHWKFDEGQGTVANDSSPYGHHGRIFGARWAPGKIGQALDFDGIDDYVQIAPDASLDNLPAVTLAAWIHPRVDSHWHVLDKGDGDKRLYSEGANRTLDGRVRCAGAHAYAKSSFNRIILNEWQHIALTWSGGTSTLRLYHNGTEVNYTSQDLGAGSPQNDADYPFTIGARGALGPVTFLNGQLDDLRLYGRPLTAPEIRDLYNSATAR